MTTAPGPTPELRLPTPHPGHEIARALLLIIAHICLAAAREFCRNPRAIAEADEFWRFLDCGLRVVAALMNLPAAREPAAPEASPPQTSPIQTSSPKPTSPKPTPVLPPTAPIPTTTLRPRLDPAPPPPRSKPLPTAPFFHALFVTIS